MERMIDTQKLIRFLESRTIRNSELKRQDKRESFKSRYEGARNEASMIVSMIKSGEFDVEEGDES